MVQDKRKKKKKAVKKINVKPRTYYALNIECDFYYELRSLLLKTSDAEFDKLAKRISTFGNIKLAIASGIFMNRKNSPVDFLIVAKKVKQPGLTNFIKTLGIEMGKEINYSIMTEKEFFYRKHMNDKFLRLLIGSPHRKLINKFGYLGKN